MHEVALSTMWGIGRFPDLQGFFAAAAALGFDRFELNHGVTSAMLRTVPSNGHLIRSVHEPCPADLSVAQLKERGWLVSALQEGDRRAGVAAVRRSIELAHDLGAPVVIVHAGRVDVDPGHERRLLEMYNEGACGTREYDRTKGKLIAVRTARAPANLGSVRRSLEELAGVAATLGVRLALENRFHYHEIPLPEELEELLGSGWGDTVGYWHDVGHAQVLEHLGLGSHEQWLRRFAPSMIGVHLHDVVGTRDHLAAGLGCVDWDLVARWLPAGALRTCEFQFHNSPEEVSRALRVLADSGCLGSSPPDGARFR